MSEKQYFFLDPESTPSLSINDCHRLVHSCNKLIFETVQADDLLIDEDEACDGHIYACVTPKELCGFIWMYPRIDNLENHVYAIEFICVDEFFRNEGTGTGMLSHFIKDLTKNLLPHQKGYIIATVDPTRRLHHFFRKNGFCIDNYQTNRLIYRIHG